MGLDATFRRMLDLGASDLLLQAGSPPIVRVDGRLERLPEPPLTAEQTRAIVASLLSRPQLDRLEEQRQLDFAVAWQDGVRFRGNAYLQQGCISLALRLLPREIPALQDIGIPDVVYHFVELPRGLVLVTGPTGSGKSTTQAAIIDAINRARPCHIITIEDPIEFVHDNALALIEQREIGRDVESFAAGLRAVFRQDPDVVLIGEMRDLETITAALTIAETGHLVFGTLHTNDAAQTIDRIVDVFRGDQQQQVRMQLANCLAGVMSQQLIPALGGGRVAAFEVLVATTAVKNLIKEGKSNQIRSLLQTSLKDGMQTLERSLSNLYQAGTVSLDEARARSLFPDEVK